MAANAMPEQHTVQFEDGLEVVERPNGEGIEVVEPPKGISATAAIPPTGDWDKVNFAVATTPAGNPTDAHTFIGPPGGLMLPAKAEGAAPAGNQQEQEQRKSFVRRSPILFLAIIATLILVIGGLVAGLTITLVKKQGDSSSAAATTATTTSTLPALITVSHVTASTSGGASTPTSSATSSAKDPTLNDQLTTSHVASWFYTGQTADQVGALCTQNQARLTQVRVDNATAPTFTVTMIQDTGVYDSDWWWYYGENSSIVGNQVSDRRLISLDPYYDSQSNLQFAVVQLPNTGSQSKAWWWYFGQNNDSINGLLEQYNARLISLRGYMQNGEPVYAIIMAENTGDDYIASQWFTGIAYDDIITQIHGGWRVLTVAPNPVKDWDVIMVTASADEWQWGVNMTFASIDPTLSKYNNRLVDISPYYQNGEQAFAIVETYNGD